jgi:hypothetical protein
LPLPAPKALLMRPSLRIRPRSLSPTNFRVAIVTHHSAVVRKGPRISLLIRSSYQARFSGCARLPPAPGRSINELFEHRESSVWDHRSGVDYRSEGAVQDVRIVDVEGGRLALQELDVEGPAELGRSGRPRRRRTIDFAPPLPIARTKRHAASARPPPPGVAARLGRPPPQCPVSEVARLLGVFEAHRRVAAAIGLDEPRNDGCVLETPGLLGAVLIWQFARVPLVAGATPACELDPAPERAATEPPAFQPVQELEGGRVLA